MSATTTTRRGREIPPTVPADLVRIDSGAETATDTTAVPLSTGATGATGATSSIGAACGPEKGSTGQNPAVLPVLPAGATADPGADILGTATAPQGAPTLADRPCWRVYDDWWMDGTTRRRPGVWYFGSPGEEEVPPAEWLCGPLHLDAITCDTDGASHGRLLRFRDALGRWHTWTMPMRMLRGSGEDLRGELLGLGLDMDPRGMRTRLHDYLVHRVPDRRMTAALRIGWHGDTYVLPDRAYGPGAADIHYQSESATHAEFGAAGTLDDWRTHVAAMAPGNIGLTLGISAAFAGPIMALAHVEHAGLHLVGESSSGKTTALQAAASVWGPPGYVRTWRATGNGLEAAAAEANDTLLVLDEIGEADPDEIGRVIYALGNGRGKSRATVLGLARRVAQWRTVTLSSGERTIAAHQSEGRHRPRAGQSVRLLDLPIAGRYGQFDALHGRSSGRHLADEVKTAAARHYGTAGRAYLEHLTTGTRPDYGDLLAAVLARFGPVEGQEARAARQLALVALAGEIATAAGITGWEPGTATDAALAAHRLWRDARGPGNAEPRRILEMVADHIDTHGGSRFERIGDLSGPVIRDRCGWIETDPTTGATRYLYTGAGLREATPGYDLARVLAVLETAGWLEPGPGGRRRRQRKIEGANHNVYVVTIPAEDAPC